MSVFESIVCIGTSTGGPGALEKVLTRLPQNFPAPLLIVQHMPPKFTKALADRLNSLTKIVVKEAEHGEIVKAGHAYIAPGGFYMRVKQLAMGLAIQLDASKPKTGHCPSVDELFESAAKLKKYKKIAVIMTGMGSDGSKGLCSLKENGETFAIAESESSSIVYGMPRAAFATGKVDQILDLDRIAAGLTEKLRSIERS